MKINFDKIKECSICNNKNFAHILNKDRYRLKLNFVSCKNCGFVFINPLPSEDFLQFFYSKKYRKYYESIKTPNKIYFNHFIFRALQRIPFVKEHFKGDKSILDIGSADGSFLYILKKVYNMDIQGIEPSSSFSSFAKNKLNLNIKNTFFDEKLSLKKKYDVITCFHVLEHYPNLDNFFNLVKKHLKKEGILYLEVPDLLGDWKGISFFHIGHLYYFTENSLNNLLKKNNFKVIKLNKSKIEGYPVLRVLCEKQEENNFQLIKENSKEIKNIIKSRTKNIFIKTYFRQKFAKFKSTIVNNLLARSNKFAF